MAKAPKQSCREHSDHAEEDGNIGPVHERCVLYDKPPHTGSQTTVEVLRTCWQNIGFACGTLSTIPERKRLVSKFLQFPDRDVALAGYHFFMPAYEVKMINAQCKELFYVTSTRTMRDRLASKAKYGVSRRIDLTDGRRVLDSQLQERGMAAVHRLNRDGVLEKIMEAYPFSSTETIQPDYVIRTDSLQKDLSQLLAAFGCATDFESKHLHDVEESVGVQPVFDKSQIVVRMNDSRHVQLSQLAEQTNSKGLEKVRRLFTQRGLWNRLLSRWKLT